MQLHTDEPERRLAVGAVLDTEAATGTGVPRALTVRSTRVHNGVWLVAFEEIPDRTGAESLRGTRLVVDGPPTSPPRRGRRLHRGPAARARRVVDPAGVVLGEVGGPGASARPRTGSSCGCPTAARPRCRSSPRIVPEVDVDGGRVVVDAPPGLLDLGV